jgi:uncharacterized protein YndB with AHSA1/START domain
VQVRETFRIGCPPEVVFDYVTDPANLPNWQTAHVSVEPLTQGPPRRGSRYRERVKGPLGRQFEQVVEFSEFERPSRLRVRVVEGPYPVDGTWIFEASGAGTSVRFTAEGELKGPTKLLQPFAQRALARQFAGYHRNLRRNLEHR